MLNFGILIALKQCNFMDYFGIKMHFLRKTIMSIHLVQSKLDDIYNIYNDAIQQVNSSQFHYYMLINIFIFFFAYILNISNQLCSGKLLKCLLLLCQSKINKSIRAIILQISASSYIHLIEENIDKLFCLPSNEISFSPQRKFKEMTMKRLILTNNYLMNVPLIPPNKHRQAYLAIKKIRKTPILIRRQKRIFKTLLSYNK